jgi:hypothetical protein
MVLAMLLLLAISFMPLINLNSSFTASQNKKMDTSSYAERLSGAINTVFRRRRRRKRKPQPSCHTHAIPQTTPQHLPGKAHRGNHLAACQPAAAHHADI